MNTGRLCLTPARDAFPMAQPAKCAIANLLVDVSFCRCYVVSLLLYVQMQRLASPVNICRKRPIGGVLLPAGSLFPLERLTHCRLMLGFAFGLVCISVVDAVRTPVDGHKLLGICTEIKVLFS